MMFSVALIGPDGAGKTTVARRLTETFPLPIKYLYMGINRDSSNCMLPTTRLIRSIKRAAGAPPDTTGPRDVNSIAARPKGLLRRLVVSMKSCVSLANRFAEEWYRQCVAWSYQLRGRIVVFDRHFYSDYYAYDICRSSTAARPLGRRIHGWMLQRLYPKPDLVVYLDAPSEVLFARKGEGTLEALERRRQEYLGMRDLVEHFVIVDAALPLDDVARLVAERILEFHRAKNEAKLVASSST